MRLMYAYFIGKLDWKSESSDGELECVSTKVT